MWSDTWLQIHLTFVFANTILCAGVMAFFSEAISHFLRGLIVSCRKDEGFIAEVLYCFRILKCCWWLYTKLTKFCILLLAKGLNFALSYRDLQKISLLKLFNHTPSVFFKSPWNYLSLLQKLALMITKKERSISWYLSQKSWS